MPDEDELEAAGTGSGSVVPVGDTVAEEGAELGALAELALLLFLVEFAVLVVVPVVADP